MHKLLFHFLLGANVVALEKGSQLHLLVSHKESSPNEVTFISALQACSHSGLADEALSLLYSMDKKNNIKPSLEHYNCIVDTLGRAGRLQEALKLAQSIQADSVTWKSLLGACRWYKNVEIASIVAKKLLEITPGMHASVKTTYFNSMYR